MLAAATKRTVSDYAAEKLWQPLGAEADATWIIDATGQEITFAYVNAVLRDWARLGLMLANRGNWQGKTVVPEDWLTASAADALPTNYRWRSTAIKSGILQTPDVLRCEAFAGNMFLSIRT